jgi:hypothetical protein
MTPKQKALQLYYNFYNQLSFDSTDKFNNKCAKQCALIAIEFAREFITGDLSESFDKTMYLFEVKQEIEKL